MANKILGCLVIAGVAFMGFILLGTAAFTDNFNWVLLPLLAIITLSSLGYALGKVRQKIMEKDGPMSLLHLNDNQPSKRPRE